MQSSPAAPGLAAQKAQSTICRYAPWVGLTSLVLWFVGPVAIVMGVIVRIQDHRNSAKTRSRRATIAIALGTIGTALFAGSAVVDYFKGRHSAERVPAVAPPSSSSAEENDRAAVEARRRQDELRDERERAATAVKAARELATNEAAVVTSLDSAQAALDKHDLTLARKALATVAPRFLPLDRAYLIPDDDADGGTRGVLRNAMALLTRFERQTATANQQRMAAYNMAFEVLWAPANAGRNEDQLLAGVGRKFGLSLEEMKTLMVENDADTTRRLKERGDAEDRADQEGAQAKANAMEGQCGPKPTRSPLAGGLPAVELYVKASAQDPASIDVENCSEPVISSNACWVTVCDVRGKNGLGAKVLNRMRFNIGMNADALAVGVVTGAQKL